MSSFTQVSSKKLRDSLIATHLLTHNLSDEKKFQHAVNSQTASRSLRKSVFSVHVEKYAEQLVHTTTRGKMMVVARAPVDFEENDAAGKGVGTGAASGVGTVARKIVKNKSRPEASRQCVKTEVAPLSDEEMAPEEEMTSSWEYSTPAGTDFWIEELQVDPLAPLKNKPKTKWH